MQPEVLQKHLIMTDYLKSSSMAEEKKSEFAQVDRDLIKQQLLKVPKKYSDPREDPKLQKDINEPIRIAPDVTVGRPTDADVKAEGVRLVNEGNARIAEAKEKYQEAEEAKHRKAEKMWSAIGDGISAIANMATVGAGADSMYNPADSHHAKVKSKWDEIKANKAAIAAAENKARMDLLLADLGYQHASAENEKNRQSRWAEYFDKAEETKRHNKEMEAIAKDRAESYETNAQANKTRASKYKGGGSSGGGGGSSKHEFLGKPYPSANARNQAILDKANELGVPTHDAEKRPRRYADVEYDIRKKLATP